MIDKKKIIIFLILVLLNNCSFDKKTGIWNYSEQEKRKVSELEKKQKQIINIEKIYSSEVLYEKEKFLTNNIVLSNPKNNLEWITSSSNNQNFLGNIYLSGIENNFLKKRIGKDKFSMHGTMSSLLFFNDNIILSDDNGTIFNINKIGKINWKKNVYKKLYKRIYKNLILSIYKNNIYIADNIGFIYAISLTNGKLLWIKNYGIPIKSNMKIFENKIFLIDQNNKIICFSVKDGSLIWGVLSISSFIKSQNLLSLAVSKEGDLYAMTTSADLFKIGTKKGNIIWSRNAAESTYAHATDFLISSEIVLSDQQIIFSSGFTIFSYDVNSGNFNWKNQVNSIGAPIVDGKNIFIVTHNGYFVILDKVTGKIISSTNILKVLKKKKQKTYIRNFIMGSGKIYAITLNGYLIESSAASGKVEYFKKIGESNISPLAINNGALYILTQSSRIIGFK